MFKYTTLSRDYQTPEDALASVGFYVDDFVFDGAYRRFVVENDKSGETSGFYKGVDEGVKFGNWRTGKGYCWHPTDHVQWIQDHPDVQGQIGLSQAELDQIQKEYDQARAELKAYWEGLPQASSTHSYFRTKKLLPDYPHIKVKPDGTLVIPAGDQNDKFLTLQYIYRTDKKTFIKRWHKGLPAKGARLAVGTPCADARSIVVCEGIGCALSIRAADPKVAVVCCFGAGNLVSVAEGLRARFPYADIIIAGDNDKPPERGQKAAKEAAIKAFARLIIPDSPCKDVSDVYVAATEKGEKLEAGREAIRTLLESAKQTVEGQLLQVDTLYDQDPSRAVQLLEDLRKSQKWTRAHLREMQETVRRQYGKPTKAFSKEKREDRARKRQKEAQQLQAQVEEAFGAIDPFDRLPDAFRALGVAGDIGPFIVTYISVTSRVLAASAYTRPSHLHVLGSSSVGKSFICDRVLDLLPSEAVYVLNCGSPKVFVYDTESLVHKVIYAKEIDVLRLGRTDNEKDDGTDIVASAMRELLTNGQCVYQYVQDGEVTSITREGPSSLLCTGLIPLSEQLSTRAWTIGVLDDMETVREALRITGKIEAGHFHPKVDQSFVQLQRWLQQGAPWKVVVPFAGDLADLISASPRAVRVMRDFSRLLTNIKTVTVLRYLHRTSKEGVLQAELEDYATVFKYADPLFETAGSGVDREIRALYEYVSYRAVQDPKAEIKVVDVEAHFNWSRTAAARRVDRAIKAGYLRDLINQKGKGKDLRPDAPLPTTTGLPTPKELAERIAQPRENTKEEPFDMASEEVKGNGIDGDGLTPEGDLRDSVPEQDPKGDSSGPRSDPDEGEFVHMRL